MNSDAIKTVAIAAGIDSPSTMTSAGTTRNPPPTPRKPVRTPTTAPDTTIRTARAVRVRPATGTEKVVERLVELLQDGCPAPLAFHREPQQDFVRRVAAEPSVVLFTGHRSNAEDVLAQLTGRHVFLYFGRGVNPVVVFPDAGLERASKEIVYSRLYNGGQDCLAPDIVLVHEDVAEELEALLTRDAAEYVTANGGRLAPALALAWGLYWIGIGRSDGEGLLSGAVAVTAWGSAVIVLLAWLASLLLSRRSATGEARDLIMDALDGGDDPVDGIR